MEDSTRHDAILFLTPEQVIHLHAGCVDAFSPGEPLAVRDHGLLRSAVMAPQHTMGGEYLYRSLAEMAAAYLVGLAQNHPFWNGNKRVAFAAASVFLRMNGYRFTLTQDEAETLTMKVASHTWGRDEAIHQITGAVAALP